ncbi:hypothetical protein T484DRAFT_2023605 [Baffinella frigidus]|nr:hypothetical protein T484DRAFT_2023605 [Cryptophyta sp. CCMP2293]
MGSGCSRGGGQPFLPVSIQDARRLSSTSKSGFEECAAALVEEFKVDPSVALRFARVRQGDFSKAQRFLRADLAWREEKRPETVTQADCPTALASGNFRLLGCTPAGLPVVFINVGLWDPSKYSLDEYERYVIYFFENMLRMGKGAKFVLIFDMQGWKFHADRDRMRKTSRLFSTYRV